MQISIAICTWNRCELLRQALEQMTQLVIPPGVNWELLVVNNNCTDATDDVIATFVTSLPIRRLFESKPGLSHARNAAVREAGGEYILWTDDDTLVHENWVAAYVEAFQRWPEAAFFGGPILPLFAVPPPACLILVCPRVAGVYATRDLGAKPLRFDGGDRVPFGANYAMRIKEQRCYRYDPQLGRKPGTNIVGEETTLIKALLADAYEGWWVPDAVVQHYIPPERMTTRYLRRFFMGMGQYYAKTEPAWEGPVLFGKPRWLWRAALSHELRYRLRRPFCQPEVWIRDLIVASEAWGNFRSKEPSKKG